MYVCVCVCVSNALSVRHETDRSNKNRYYYTRGVLPFSLSLCWRCRCRFDPDSEYRTRAPSRFARRMWLKMSISCTRTRLHESAFPSFPSPPQLSSLLNATFGTVRSLYFYRSRCSSCLAAVYLYLSFLTVFSPTLWPYRSNERWIQRSCPNRTIFQYFNISIFQ